jgi:hypothetical protein
LKLLNFTRTFRCSYLWQVSELYFLNSVRTFWCSYFS